MGIFRDMLRKQAAVPAGEMLRSLKGPAIGAAVGAGGMYGLSQLGEKEIQKREEAEELRQLLEEYPELMMTTPSPYDEVPSEG